MAKKDDAGSGLRAGFIRSDGPPQPPKKKKPEGSEQKVAAPTLPPAETKPADPKEVTGPTITMRGVSGKK